MISLHSADLVLYCEAFLTTYRTFISPEELIKKLQYRYPSRPTGVTVCISFMLFLKLSLRLLSMLK